VTPIRESAPTRPTNPYGASKLAVDHMLTSYAGAHGFAAVSLRYFNVAGALISDPASVGDGLRLGERHDTETHLIPIALQVASGQRDQLAINGVDYPTPDGTCVRDYIHVLDLADAHLRALDRVLDRVSGSSGSSGSAGSGAGGEHLICNLGSGSGSSVREVVETVRRVTGKPTPAVEGPRRPGDPAILVASNELAAAELGWTPTRDLEQMVTDAWRFVS